MIYFEKGDKESELSSIEIKEGVFKALDLIGTKSKVLAVPPDFTRYHSRAGELTGYAYQYYGKELTHILPALGTHAPMTGEEVSTMFESIPGSLFHEHNWRSDIQTIGVVPGEYIKDVSNDRVNYEWKAQVNKLLIEGEFDLVLSIGQVVPHEVIGMANHNKNIFIGTGGPDAINKSHFLGAVHGMERIMGKTNSPVRDVLDYASDKFSHQLPTIIYLLTVIGRNKTGKLVIRGLFIGNDKECFFKASELSQQVNIETVESPIKKVVVYLDPAEYKSTWLGNKAIYRSRMAMADEGELIILAPGLKEFGEDKVIDRLIRKYGYYGTADTLESVNRNQDLQDNLSAAAHLIHGSSEERFLITYCPGKLSEKEIRSVNFNYANPDDMLKKYNPEKLFNGFNKLPNGEEIFFISNPALGLWSVKEKIMN